VRGWLLLFALVKGCSNIYLSVFVGLGLLCLGWCVLYKVWPEVLVTNICGICKRSIEAVFAMVVL
jgi:hypothetical protein